MSEPSFFTVYNASAGSGKTYTLVRDYLTLILDPRRATGFQKILAITFTNKAAGEMKDRVLKHLVELATSDPQEQSEAPDGMKEYLIRETGQSAEELRDRALLVLHQILRDYGSFNVRTIDSFTNKLIKSFAFDLGLSMDFEVELDTDSIFQEAVDTLISRIGIDPELTSILLSYSSQKAREDKSWDISRDLLEISTLLLNENHIRHLEGLREKKLTDFLSLYRALRAERKRIGDLWKEKGSAALELIGSRGLEPSDFYRSQVPNFFDKLIRDQSRVVFEKGSSIEQNLEEGRLYSKAKPQETKDSIDEIAGELLELYRESESSYEESCLYELIMKNLVPLAVLSSIHRILEEIKTENNIRLNAEFNQLISKHLRDQPAAFIYERIGERFKYFFIDEMQDTSVLQWLNLIPLLSNALSGEGSGLMLVGDAKQAIYRWRGGRPEQFIELSLPDQEQGGHPFVVGKQVRNLERNYRSFSQIVEFNNRFFTYLSRVFADESYRDLYKAGNEQECNDQTGGYVEIRFLDPPQGSEERNEVYPAAVLEKVRHLLKQFEPEEICVLVRKKAQGVAVARHLVEHGIDILSSETLMLENNDRVRFIIEFLKFREDPANREALFEVLSFLYAHWKVKEDVHLFYRRHINLGFEELMESLRVYGLTIDPGSQGTYSIYEEVEAIIRSFALNDSSDAFVQFFLDFVFDFTQRRSQKGIGFLEYWEEKKDKLNIASSEDSRAVRIMTIHKSKGLEFPVVVFPYDMEVYGDRKPEAWYEPLEGDLFQGFESLLVSASSGVQKTGQRGREIYEESRTRQELDSANLLYVCLTRAVEQLYVITEKRNEQDRPAYSSDLLREGLKHMGLWEEDRSLYVFGSDHRLSERKAAKSEVQVQRELISSSWKEHDLHLVSTASLLWDTHRGEAIEFGNLVHELMAEIDQAGDLNRAVSAAVNRGLLGEAEREEMEARLMELVLHPELKTYFEPGAKVLTERPLLLSEGRTVVPDRLVLRGKEAWILDYKTGSPEPAHQEQIRHYGMILSQMGYEVREMALVYLDNPVKVIKLA